MVTVAIAGATSTVGMNIVKEILTAKKHNLIVLSRTEQPGLTERGADVRVVDYSDSQSLTSALQGVHTVISCVWVYDPQAVLAIQLDLLKAAKAAGVKRFAPSEWATSHNEAIYLYSTKPDVFEAVKASGLEHTRFVVGLWMNLWGVGAPNHAEEATAGYKGLPLALDLEHSKVTIPGDGNNKVVFTRLEDIGRFVTASLDLNTWEPDSMIVGDRISFNEVVKLAEAVTGKKLEVTYIPVEQITAALKAEPDLGTKFFFEYLLAITEDILDFTPTLNQRLPAVKPVTAEEYLKRYWATA